MDFSTMKEKVKKEYYQTLDELKVSSLRSFFFSLNHIRCNMTLTAISWPHNGRFGEQTDFKIMCENAMIYNKPDTIYYKAAKKLLHSGMKILNPVSSPVLSLGGSSVHGCS